jgi:hypothetical protein
MRKGADVVLTFCNASAVSRSEVASITRRVALSLSDRHAFVIAPGRSRRPLSHKSRKATSVSRRNVQTRTDQGLKRRFSESHHREAILMLRPIELQADLARLSTL